jgi:hypothetical protein
VENFLNRNSIRESTYIILNDLRLGSLAARPSPNATRALKRIASMPLSLEETCLTRKSYALARQKTLFGTSLGLVKVDAILENMFAKPVSGFCAEVQPELVPVGSST